MEILIITDTTQHNTTSYQLSVVRYNTHTGTQYSHCNFNSIMFNTNSNATYEKKQTTITIVNYYNNYPDIPIGYFRIE